MVGSEARSDRLTPLEEALARAKMLASRRHKVHLLSAEEYRARFHAAQSSMHKSLLVVVGLLAFWLALENYLVRHRDLQNEYVKMHILQAEISKGKIDLRTRLLALKDRGASDDDAASLINDQKTHIETLKEQMEDVKELDRELKKDAIGFSLAGTTMETQLVIAPSMWFFVLCGWLLYFLTRRESALRNIAAFQISRREGETRFGDIGDGSVWLAPLPRKLSLQDVPSQRHDVEKHLVAHCIGWNLPSTNQRNRQLLWFLAFVLLLIELRVLYIAAEVTGWTSVRSGSVGLLGHYAGIMLPAFLFAASSFQLYFWLARPNVADEFSAGSINMVRRQLVIGASSAFCAFGYTVWRDGTPIGAIFGSVGRQSAAQLLPPENLRYPRFIPRAWRNGHYVVRTHKVDDVPSRATFLSRQRSGWSEGAERAVLHYADQEGRVRLFSAAPVLKNLQPVDDRRVGDSEMA